MGVSWDQNVLELLACFLKCYKQALNLVDSLFNPCPGVKLQVNENLVIPGAPGVYLLPDLSQFAGKHQFHLGMNILHVGLNLESTLAYQRVQ